MNLNIAKRLLPEARELAGLASDEWSESYDTKNMHAEICIHDRLTGEVTPIAMIGRACSYDDRRLMIRAPLLIRALLACLDAAIAKIRRLEARLGSPVSEQDQSGRDRDEPNYAAECSMRCDDPVFRRFLQEETKLSDVSDAKAVEKHVRYLLKVDSRKELNSDAGARKRWRELRAKFNDWERKVNGRR